MNFGLFSTLSPTLSRQREREYSGYRDKNYSWRCIQTAPSPAGGRGRGRGWIASFLLYAASAALAQNAPVFTAEQAEAGRALYQRDCASCHGDNLDDGRFGLPLRGAAFRNRWAGHPLQELFALTRDSMPPAAPGSLSNGDYAALLAFLLQANAVEPGPSALPAEERQLFALNFPGVLIPQQQQLRTNTLGVAAGTALPAWPAAANPLDAITPVSDAMLANPAAADWLTWRRAQDGLGFSPLAQITPSNVATLKSAWSLALPPGPNLATPLVHDGVLFVHGYGDHVQALDAKTGDELWHYARRLPDSRAPSVKRNMALYGDKLYLATSDFHLIALDVKSGALVWDYAFEQAPGRWEMTGGPLVAKGKVMQGFAGQGAGGPYIVGLDAESGAEQWRFYTVARPGEPGGESWNGLPLEQRSGGSIWTAGTYDAELGLAFFGPGPTYDTEPLRKPLNQSGITNDALYTDATLALDPDNGQLVWHYQHLQNDQWDLDWAFERQVVNLPGTDGATHKYVITAGKPGIYDVLDAATGRYARSFDMGLQNFIVAIDPVTGVKTVNPELVPGDGRKVTVCPHAVGGRNWLPSAYDPQNGIVYVPAVESCMDMTPVEAGGRGFLSSGVRLSVIARPDSDGRYGRIQALDAQSGATLWTARQRAPQTTGVLATAGGVIFAGALDRRLSAYDAKDGALLWQSRLSDVPNSAPISYSVDGKQYIAMVVGYGGIQPVTFASLVPEIPLPVARSSSIFVFELP
ncbi:MAG: PQQ-binding-like beta-propeller repeat protein [Pseudomonadales bacterium]|jgi:alcohol dehydrogenase (cytochrome c)|nr:PQQ-binding-like beta-propeller repeat protein [Pseudomonadales bacterium]